LVLSTHRAFHASLLDSLEKRYGKLKIEEDCKVHCGIGIIRHPGTKSAPTGPISLNQALFITRFSENLGITHLPPIFTPCTSEFFKPPTDSTPVEPAIMQKIVGGLVHTLATRDDARKEIVYLSKKQNKPTQSDYDKAIHVWRYLYSTRFDGPVFDTNDGPYLTASADAAHNIHINSESHLAAIISIGHTNSPCRSASAYEENKPDKDPFTAEYHSLHKVVNMILPAYELLEFCGFPQTCVPILQDNKTCVDLANSEHITPRAKHIPLVRNIIREKIRENIIRTVLTKSENMTIDLMTKYYPKQKFAKGKHALFNYDSLPSSDSTRVW
jgi:hypothetical protein